MLAKIAYLLMGSVTTGICIANDFNRGVDLRPVRIFTAVLIGALWFPLALVAAVEHMLVEMGFMQEYKICKRKEKK